MTNIRLDHVYTGDVIQGDLYYHEGIRTFILEWRHKGDMNQYFITADAVFDNSEDELGFARVISQYMYEGTGYVPNVDTLYREFVNYMYSGKER